METYEWYRSFTWIGVLVILLGIVLVLIPHLVRYAPDIEKLPPIILYVYRRDGFIFATSPILIAISIVWALVSALNR